jgi:hypothetical protein
VRKEESGIVILLVAVVLLFVVGAMAALSIDVVTFYTARSEAQLAADSAALAGARVLANSGMTSDPNASTDGLMVNAKTLANTIATEIAMRNVVGGRTLFPANGEINVSFNDTDPSFVTNPRVTVRTSRADLPTFFARIWGRAVVSVQASATAEAYNPSGASALGATVTPVAPACVMPWVLPNITPTDGTSPIINSTSGAIMDTLLVGENITGTPLTARCRRCTSNWRPPQAWQYYPGDQSSFPAPTSALPSCASSFTPYQQSIAGCVQSPIACLSTVNLDASDYSSRNTETASAVDCLVNAPSSQADSVDPTSGPTNGMPFQFLAGPDDPLVKAGTISAGTDIMVSDSIVTVPIYNSNSSAPPPGPPGPVPVTVIGFVQLFLNPLGAATPGNGNVPTMVINIAGCGTGATGQPILGNGASPIPVRLIARP